MDLVQEWIEVARESLEFGPIFNVFDEINIGVISSITSDADVKIRIKVVNTGASNVVHVFLLFVGGLKVKGDRHNDRGRSSLSFACRLVSCEQKRKT